MKLTEREAGQIEGFAKALDMVYRKYTDDTMCAKHYDPMTVDLDDKLLDSYAFDLKDGGRHHPFSDYKDIEELKKIMFSEFLEWIKED